MSGIQFDEMRWEHVKDVYRQWWAGELDRPLIPVTLRDRDPGRPEPDVPVLSQASCADFAISPEQMIDRMDYELCKCTFLGDAYPFVNMMHFGPGVVAAFLGATLDNSTGQVWFHAEANTPIESLHLAFEPDNKWFRRLCDIYAAGMNRWQGQVLMGMTDLGGTMDILSTFLPGEQLLMALYESPDEVKRLIGEVHTAWHQYYDAFNEILPPLNPGYSDLMMIYSESPTYILQSDFSYMISPDQFDEFVKPELTASCRRLSHTLYHLDGKGQLGHLDSLLAIPELDCVQWVPGTGMPSCGHWPEVYEKIAGAGKLIQLHGSPWDLDAVADHLGTAKGIHMVEMSGADTEAKRAMLGKYDVPD